MKPFIDPLFWSDPDIEAQKAGVKLCSLWLITNSQTSLLGVCGASSSRFCFETGLPLEALQSTLQALPKSFVKIGSSIFVRNYIRHQFGSGEKLTKNNFFVALKSLFISVKDEKLQSEILKEYPEFKQALTKPSTRAYQAQGKEGKEGEGVLPDSPEKVKLSQLFRRRPSSKWDEKEIKAYKSLLPFDPIELDLIFRYTESERKKGDSGIHRRDLVTLLNNYATEADRAHEWARRNPKSVAAANGHAKPTDAEPDGFRVWLGTTYPNGNLTVPWNEITTSTRKEFYEQQSLS